MYKDYIKWRGQQHQEASTINTRLHQILCLIVQNNGGGKLILHYTYNGVVNTVTEEMGLSD